MPKVLDNLDAGTLTGYCKAHEAVKAKWGKASNHGCVVFWETALDRAYQHTAGANEKHVPENKGHIAVGAPYSENVEDYAPMCRKRHNLLDAQMDTRQREALSSGGINARANDKARWVKNPQLKADLDSHLLKNSYAIASRMKNDPEFYRLRQSQLRANALVRSVCEICGYESNAGNVARHQRSVLHGRFYLKENV